ncbi:MAG TPA: hypothetical protein VNW25_04585 [Candidatus Sulfotelmatobacter sp.]|nr:hypothetical protein [Candidatus Sulfotelmatobacter sp.]
MAEPASEEQREEYLRISRWRETERAHMIAAMHEMIDEASKRAKSRRAPPGERIRWTRLAGQLIWYKDSLLRSMTQEAMERELIVLKHQVLAKQAEEKPPPGYIFFGQPPAKQEPTNKT